LIGRANKWSTIFMQNDGGNIPVDVGSEALGFNLAPSTGEEIRLSYYRGQKNVILFIVWEFT